MTIVPQCPGTEEIFIEKWHSVDTHSQIGKRLLTINAIEKAYELNHKDQIDNAVELLLEGIRHSPDDKRPYYALSEMLIDAKQFKDALDVLNEMPPDDRDVKKLALIGYCKEGMEIYDDAEKYADHALSLNASSALVLNLKGILAYKQGDKSAAEDFFNRAIESDPSYGEPFTNLGVIKWAIEQGEEALNLFERGFMLSPTAIDIVTTYHSAVTALSEFERAEQVFRDANSFYPQNKRLKYLLIDIFIQQGKHDLAMKEIEEAIIEFGMDDGIISAALKIRKMLGPKEIEKKAKKKGTVSLSMIVKDEEKYLAKCLTSVKSVFDEMIVVDTGSTDKTKEIAKAFGAKVYDLDWNNDFSEARNFSLEKASGDWIFVMDADEVISPLDYDTLRKITSRATSRPLAYSFQTRNYILTPNTFGWTANDGRYLIEEAANGWFPGIKVRLFHNNKGIRFEYPVHEMVEPSLKRGGIAVKECSIPIHHYGKLNEEKNVNKGEDYYQMGKKKLDDNGRRRH